jgi:hypothetical protein
VHGQVGAALITANEVCSTEVFVGAEFAEFSSYQIIFLCM